MQLRVFECSEIVIKKDVIVLSTAVLIEGAVNKQTNIANEREKCCGLLSNPENACNI